MNGFENSQNDSALGVQTPEGIEFFLYPAGFPIRACALAIDGFIQGVCLTGILIAVAFSGFTLGTWFLFIIIFALNWFYHLVFEIFNRGQSPGKKIMGIRVVRSDGSPVNPGASFLRNLLRFADTFMSLYHFALVCMLVSPGFRRIGDWVADTLVVYAVRTNSRFASPALKRSGLPWLLSVTQISPPRSLDYEEKQAILMFARRYPLLGKARADEIAGIWAGKLRGSLPEGGIAHNDISDSEYLLGIALAISGMSGVPQRVGEP